MSMCAQLNKREVLRYFMEAKYNDDYYGDD